MHCQCFYNQSCSDKPLKSHSFLYVSMTWLYTFLCLHNHRQVCRPKRKTWGNRLTRPWARFITLQSTRQAVKSIAKLEPGSVPLTGLADVVRSINGSEVVWPAALDVERKEQGNLCVYVHRGPLVFWGSHKNVLWGSRRNKSCLLRMSTIRSCYLSQGRLFIDL